MSKIVTGKSVKRPGSAVSGASESDAKKRSRKPVEIPEDVFLEALKHLACPKWSKIRLVSHHLNGMVQRNVSRLPMAMVDYAAMNMRVTYSLMPMLRKQRETVAKMIVSDSNISSDEQDQWFKDRGMTIDLSGNIQLNNAIIGLDFEENCCVDLCILGPAQKNKLISFEKKTCPWFSGQQFKAEILFYAEFSPHRNKYSWAYMAFFLKLLYDSSTFVKKLSMFALDEKLKEILFPGEEDRYIRCGSFKLQVSRDASVGSVSWLEQNVQADNIRIPYYNVGGCDSVADYLLGSSWTSASQVVKLGRVYDLERFFKALIKKFQTDTTVQSIFPTILFSGDRPIHDDPLDKLLSGKGIVKEERGNSEEPESDDYPETSESVQESENSEDDSDDYQSDHSRIPKPNYGRDGIYTISNGANRMRIEFVKEYEKPPPPRRGRVMTVGRLAYGYDIRVRVKASK